MSLHAAQSKWFILVATLALIVAPVLAVVCFVTGEPAVGAVFLFVAVVMFFARKLAVAERDS